MNLHTLIPGTVALWQLQSDFKDTSGNALDLTPVDATTHVAAASPGFIALSDRTFGVTVNDACLTGANLLLSHTALQAPLTSLLQFTGAMTIEWLMYQPYTFEWTYFACANPANAQRSGDRLPSLYTVWSDSGNPHVSDEIIGSNLPSPNYGQFPGYNDHTLSNWANAGSPQSGDWHTHHFAAIRSAAGDWRVLRDGVYIGGTVLSAGTNTASGAEQFFIGSTEHAFVSDNSGAVFASVRVLNYERTNGGILADATAALAACGGGGGGGGSANSGGGSLSTDTGIVYDAVAAAQFGIALRQGPRS